jgi:acetyltransferase-like isoleucine patch superfamily enzyme
MEVTGNVNDNEIVGKPAAQAKFLVNFKSHGCRLEIGENCRFIPIEIHFQQPNQLVRFGDGVTAGGWIYVRGVGGQFVMGARTQAANSIWVNIGEDGNKVVIGEDCLFAYVKFRTSDSHPMFDLTTGERLNESGEIHVGDKVWLAEDVMLLRNARIGDGSVVGARSLVTGEIPPNSLAVGTPARVVRSNVRWER